VHGHLLSSVDPTGLTDVPAQPPAAANAWNGGINLAQFVESDLHNFQTSCPELGLNIKAGGYIIAPQLNANHEVVYYLATNIELNRLEFAISPKNLETFLDHTLAYRALAGAAMGVSPRMSEYDAESARVVFSIMSGDLSGALKHVGASWNEAYHDPHWWMQTLTMLAGGAAERAAPGPAKAFESEVARQSEGKNVPNPGGRTGIKAGSSGGGGGGAPKGSANPVTRAAAGRGSTLHADKPGHLPDQLRARYPNTQFVFKKSGVAGQDVQVVGGTHPSAYPGSSWPAGVDFADFKPNTTSGARTFRSDQANKWSQPTHMLPYSQGTGTLQ
jgi:hypothetical protein